MRADLRIVAAIMFAVCIVEYPASAQSLETGQFASGTFLIAVQGGAARELYKRRLFGSDALNIELPNPQSDESGADAFNWPPRAWISTPPERIEGELGPSNGTMWDRAHAFVDNPAGLQSLGFAGPEMEQLTRPNAIYTIEPDVAIWDPADEEGYARLTQDVSDANINDQAWRPATRAPDTMVASLVTHPRTNKFEIGTRRSPAWPPADNASLLWHFDPQHSDLARARGRVSFGERKVVVFHLDTGYYPRISAINPRFLDTQRSISFLAKDGYGQVQPPPNGHDRFDGGRLGNDGHGAATLSILAGDEVSLPWPDSSARVSMLIGGAPFTRVVSCRVGDSVVHFRTETITNAIDYAVQQGADVITMAAGGPPSWRLLDAVNNAYERGVPMIFAAGDYFAFARSIQLLTGFRRTPHTTVYPARFSRALAVTGATSAHGNYADGTVTGFFSDRSVWAMRGSYGPERVLKHSLAAYTPNVVAHQARSRYDNTVTMQFAGTSAATPQVAAAAALWLQKHGSDLRIRKRNWHRAEAVYQALFQSARVASPEEKPHPYFGRGVLNAYRALDKLPSNLTLRYRLPSEPEKDWLRVAGILINIGARASRTVPKPVQVAQIAGDFPASEVRPDESKAEAHNRMLVIEVLQLYHGSNLLQTLLGPDPDTATPNEVEQFLHALAQDPRASQFLRDRIRVSLTGSRDR